MRDLASSTICLNPLRSVFMAPPREQEGYHSAHAQRPRDHALRSGPARPPAGGLPRDPGVAGGSGDRGLCARPTCSTRASPPRDLGRAPALRWVQLHMAGVNALRTIRSTRETAIPLTTTSGVHAATIAEYAVDDAAGPRPPRAAHGGVAGAGRLAAGRGALAALRADRGAGRDARHHRLREHRPRARAHREGRVRDDGAGVQARSRAPGRRRLRAARHRRSGRACCPTSGSGPAQLDALLARSDVVVLCAPLTRRDARPDRREGARRA